MKNNKILLNAVLVIAFAVFNVIIFQVPVERTQSFWCAYGFTCVAFAIQLYVWNVTLVGEESVRSKFLGYPIAHVSVLYLLTQLFVCAFVVANTSIAQWKVIVGNTVVLGFALICICFTQIGKNYISSVDEQVIPKVAFIKNILAELEIVASDLTSDEEKNVMEKLIEVVRYSDPMSSESLGQLEREIQEIVDELSVSQNKKADAENLIKLFNKRNTKCRELK